MVVEILSHDMPFAERPARVVSAHDVTERLDAENRLQRSYDELRALTARFETIREEESTRIAREVHDEVGQALTAIKMDVCAVGRALAAGGAPGAVAERLGAIGKLLDDTMDTVQRIATELRPGVLDGFGLEEAVEWQVEEFRKGPASYAGSRPASGRRRSTRRGRRPFSASSRSSSRRTPCAPPRTR